MTDGQLDLLGLNIPEEEFRPVPPPGKAPAKAHQLFLALRPQRSDIPPLSSSAQSLKQKLGSAAAKPVSPDLFHITLLDIDHFPDVYPQVRLDAIQAACSRAACPAIPVRHNRVMSFSPSGALVLLCSAEAEKAIRHLRTALSAALKAIGVGSKASSTPHLTTFYDQHLRAPEIPLDEPLTWHAVEFSLVVSHKGLGYHQIVRNWPLGR